MICPQPALWYHLSGLSLQCNSPFYMVSFPSIPQTLVGSWVCVFYGPLAKVFSWSWDSHCQAQDLACIWDTEIFTKRWKCRHERHLKTNLMSFTVWPKGYWTRSSSRVLMRMAGFFFFFAAVNTHVVFSSQCFWVSMPNVETSFSSKISPIYLKMDSILESGKCSERHALSPSWVHQGWWLHRCHLSRPFINPTRF